MDDLMKELETLEGKIRATEAGQRYLFQAELHGLIEKMIKRGHKVPSQVQLLDEELTADAIEAQFDNMPV